MTDLFDANAFFGGPTLASTPWVSWGDLIERMDRVGIARALVWHVAQRDCAPQAGNCLLCDALGESDRLCGCWTILPPQTEEVIAPDFFASMKQNGVVALRAFPDPHHYLLNRTVFGAFLDEVAERRVPVLLSLSHGASWESIYGILGDYPTLTCIVCDVGTWNQDRHLWPLLENYPNVYAETSMVSVQAGGADALVRRYGATRLVFGTGFPERYPEAAVLDLLNLDISDAEKQAIASGNLSRIMSEVML